MAKKIILIFLGVVAVVVGGLTAYISMVDWNSHKTEIAEKFSEITGKKIEFAGEISVSLLPQPTLVAGNINIYNPQKPDEKLATIDHMDTQVTLSSLLEGAPVVKSLSLIGAEIWITEDADGFINWRNNKNNTDNFSETEANTKLQSLNVQNALIHYQNERLGVEFDLSQINADIHADSLLGPYRLDGNFMKDSDHFGVAVSLGSFALLTDISLNFAITHPKSESYLRFDGYYLANEGGFKGDFSGGSQKTADFANILSGMRVLEETYNVPLQFSVGIVADNEKVDLSSFVIKYSNFIEGSGNITVPLREEDGKKRTASVKYQLVNLDLRPIWSVIKAEYEKYKAGGSIYEPDTKMNIVADISAERVILNDGNTGYFENLTLKGDWTDNALSVNDFYATCPGNTALTLSGSLLEENSAPQYFMKVAVSGSDFLAFLNTFDLKLQASVQATYRNVDLTFNLSGNNTAVAAQDIKFLMDKMQIEGSAGLTVNDNVKEYDVQLHADTINIDNYLPKHEETHGAMANLKADLSDLSFLKWTNLNASLSADKAVFHNAQIKKAALDFNSMNGVVTIRKADIGDVYDSSFNATGTIKDLGTEDVNFAQVAYDLKSQNIGELINVLQLPLPDWKIYNAKNFSASGQYDGDLRKGRARIDVTADAVRFDYEGTVEQNEKFGFDGTFSLKTTNFGEFVNNVGGNLKVSANTRGALNCSGTVKGTSSQGEFTDAFCMLGVAKYNGNIQYGREQGQTKIAGNLSVDELNIENAVETQSQMGGAVINRLRGDNFLPRPEFDKDVFVYDMYRGFILDLNLAAEKAIYKDKVFNNVQLHILNAENTLRLEDLHLTYKGIDTTGRLEINYENQPQAKISMDWKDVDLSGIGGSVYQFLSGKMNVKTEFESSASSIDSLMNNATGNLNFNISDFEFKGWDFAKISEDLNNRKYSKGLFQKLRDNLQQGQTTFDGFNGKVAISGGNWKFEEAAVQNENVDIDVSGTINLSEWKLNNIFTVTLHDVEEDMPPFLFSWSGLINKPVLDVNVENIVNKYDAHWKKIEEEEQAKKEAEQQALNNKMTLAQQEVDIASDGVHELAPVIEDYMKNSEDALQISWYKQQLENLNNINKNLDIMAGKAHIPGFTESDVIKIEENSKMYQEEVIRIRGEVEQHYVDDVTMRYRRTEETASKLAENSQSLYTRYQQMVQNNFDALLKIEASQYMITNPVLKELQKSMEQQNSKMGDLDAEYEAQFEAMSEIKDIALLEKSVPSLSDIIKNMEQVYAQMDKIYDDTETALQNLLLERQQIYDKQQEEKEAKRRAEEAENAGNLLAERPAEEQEDKPDAKREMSKILAEPQAVSTPDTHKNYINNGLPQPVIIEPDTNVKSTLLRLSNEDETPKVSGTIRKSYDDTENTDQPSAGSGLLKAVDGAVQKPTGTIIVK